VPARISPAWVSPERFAEYERAADGDLELATHLYEWNAEVSAALFEVIHHFEVLLRNTIITKLERNGQSPRLPPGTPWVQGEKSITEVVKRLEKAGKDVTAARVYAGLTFGFWQTMFGNSALYEELWRHALNYVFSRSRGRSGRRRGLPRIGQPVAQPDRSSRQPRRVRHRGGGAEGHPPRGLD